jgi:hypothetical protein
MIGTRRTAEVAMWENREGSAVETYDFNVITDPSTRAGGGISRVCDYGSSFKSEKKTRLNRNCRKFHLTASASNFE